MTKQSMVVGPGLTPDWLKKRRGIMGAIEDQLILGLERPGAGLTLDQLQVVVEHRNPFETVVPLKPEVIQAVRSVEELLADWVTFYREVFGEEVDFSGLKVPERRQGFDRLIVVARGMSPERVFQKCHEHFRCWKYTNQSLDEIVFDVGGVEQKYRRSDHETHAVWVHDRVEADQELKNRSANNLAAAAIPGITLEARELYELKYFKETGEGKHLDIRSVTLCTGSRDVNGSVPRVHWCGYDDKVYVSWYSPSSAGDDLRSREAVS